MGVCDVSWCVCVMCRDRKPKDIYQKLIRLVTSTNIAIVWGPLTHQAEDPRHFVQFHGHPSPPNWHSPPQRKAVHVDIYIFLSLIYMHIYIVYK